MGRNGPKWGYLGRGRKSGIKTKVESRWLGFGGENRGLSYAADIPGETIQCCVCGGLGAVGGVGLVEEIAYMVADGFDADDQLFAYLLAGLSGTDTAQHFNLSLGQAVGESRQRCRLGFGLHLKDGYPLHERRHSKLGGD